ncbi:FAD binding domain [Sulfitobacter noctilucicola]|uniref:Fumarate reductase flavoprotein subunit n=1 Tax=Sulfitobacter noctilucicola TaxID=1342301 RepID=A0A7W6MBI4_9RHOB|nr:FAD-dependent oxidoreductase [Sulfitobacter noctilucicola]KIN63478.1 FAD binding domain [Sulfitobacter noctilucicola]MBB4175011.1 fumarate reductase flavoprotein subunit [Sulfitobacter noctilucicola]
MTELVTAPPAAFDIDCETLIIGAGACGLVAALAAHEAGQEVLVIEADAVPSGSTALSAGLIPAAGTAQQRGAGIDDTAEIFAQDIQDKAHNENDQGLVDLLAQNAGPVIDWLTETHGLPFSVVTNFDYPGHSRRRMHGLPTRAGSELINALRAACEAQGIDVICGRRAATLFRDGDEMCGVAVTRPDGGVETLGCKKLILASNGFGGNRKLVSKYMPQIDDGIWFGHDGNQGEAMLWGEALGASLKHLGAYQGHGNVAHPHGILITWAVITQGGVQVNRDGKRFWNEAQGYSEAARAVLSQPGGEAFAIFDSRIAAIAAQFEDFKQAQSVGAIRSHDTLDGLADDLGVPAGALTKTIGDIPDDGTDAFGRVFSGTRLQAPYCGVRVTGALFHTQGGLEINEHAQVLSVEGTAFPNLYAGGGAACGVSGKADSGYLSGNGLLSAVVLGRLAGSTPLSGA